MKRLALILGLLLLPSIAFATCATDGICYVDPDVGGSLAGTAANPWTSLTASAWTTLNAGLASTNVTVYFSAVDTDGTTAETGVKIDLNRTDQSTHVLTLIQGNSKSEVAIGSSSSKYNTNNTTPNWVSYIGSGKFSITGNTPISTNNDGSPYTLRRYISIQGCKLDSTANQIAFIRTVDHFTLDSCDMTQSAGNGPGVAIGQSATAAAYAQYVTISNNTIHGSVGEAIYLSGHYSDQNPPGVDGQANDHITISGNILYGMTMNGSSGNADGIDIKDGNTNVVITGNEIYSPSTSDSDAIVVESCSLIEGNFIHDMLGGNIRLVSQYYLDTFGRSACNIRNNIIEQATGYSLIIAGSSMGVSSYAAPVIENNTFYNHTSGNELLHLQGAITNAVVKNNIFQATGTDVLANFGTTQLAAGGHDYNFYRKSSGNLVTYNGTSYNAASLTTFETNSKSTDPLLVSTASPYLAVNFKLQSSSPALGVGVNLFTTFTTDYFATPRPSSGAWDIGAYQHPAGAYYYSKAGSDANSCATAQSATPANAKLTIAAAVACATVAGNTVTSSDTAVQTYYERITIPNSGTSGNPITIRGARGSASEYLTIVDGSDAVVGTWTAATNNGLTGSGTYRIAQSAYGGPYTGPISGLSMDPCSLTVNGLNVWPINYDMMSGVADSNYTSKTGFQLLAVGSTFNLTSPQTGDTVNMWDGVEALMATTSGFLYYRDRSGGDPNTKTIRVAPWSYRCDENNLDFGTFTINNKSYVTISNFQIQGAPVGVLVTGAASTGNIISSNSLLTSGPMVQNQNGPTTTTVSSNTMSSNMAGAATGQGLAFSYYTPPIVASRTIASNIYNVDKYVADRNQSTFSNGVLSYQASGLSMTGNTITNVSNALNTTSFSGSNTISGSTIHNIFGSCIYWGDPAASSTLTIATNILYECGNIPMRTNGMQSAPSSFSLYIYGNKVYNPVTSGGIGLWLQLSIGTATQVTSPVYVYHNTIVGGHHGFLREGDGASVLPNALFINNLVQLQANDSGHSVYYASTAGDFCSNTARLGYWDYNWSFGQEDACVWVGAHNVNATATIITDTSLPSSWNPSGAAQNAGIDIAHTFTVNSIMYSALPGFSPGYFTSTNPDIGAVQTSDTTPPVPGNSGILATSSITTSSISVSWTKASDAVYPQSQLTYHVFYSLTNNITTLATAEANGTLYDSALNISGEAVGGLTQSTTYYFNIEVCDPLLNCTVYTSTSATTASATPLTDTLSFTTQPTNTVSGSPFSPVVVVTVSLSGGGTDTAATGHILLSISGGCGASLSGTQTRDAVAGVATFTGLAVNTAATGCTISAIGNEPILAPVTSSSFNVTALPNPPASGGLGVGRKRRGRGR